MMITCNKSLRTRGKKSYCNLCANRDAINKIQLD